jgi:hypothetical protein
LLLCVRMEELLEEEEEFELLKISRSVLPASLVRRVLLLPELFVLLNTLTRGVLVDTFGLLLLGIGLLKVFRLKVLGRL